MRDDCDEMGLRMQEMNGEIELMQIFNHKHIARYYGSGSYPQHFIVMELLEGGTLNQRMGFVPRFGG